MSRTMYVEYHGDGLWAYDVAMGVLLKHLIDSAESYASIPDSEWIVPCIRQWRVNAIVSDLGVHLDENWTYVQRQTVHDLIGRACGQLGARPSIPSEEMKSWDILDGQGVYARGAAMIPTAPVVELARAVQDLLYGNLPPAPEGYWWLFGTEEGRGTIKKK